MKFKVLIIIPFLFNFSCAQNNYKNNQNKPYNSKGFAYIYNETDYNNRIITKKLNNNLLEIAHQDLRPYTLIKVINAKTNKSIILKNKKKISYPNFYTILISKKVAEEINLNPELPLVEVLELKKNKSFKAKKSKIYQEERKIHSSAPVETVKIDNISINKTNSKLKKEKFNIIIGEFYSRDSAIILKKRITEELKNFSSKKLHIKTKKKGKTILLSGPYTTINSVKNDYIKLIDFGFEELDISINE